MTATTTQFDFLFLDLQNTDKQTKKKKCITLSITDLSTKACYCFVRRYAATIKKAKK